MCGRCWRCVLRHTEGALENCLWKIILPDERKHCENRRKQQEDTQKKIEDIHSYHTSLTLAGCVCIYVLSLYRNIRWACHQCFAEMIYFRMRFVDAASCVSVEPNQHISLFVLMVALPQRTTHAAMRYEHRHRWHRCSSIYLFMNVILNVECIAIARFVDFDYSIIANDKNSHRNSHTT